MSCPGVKIAAVVGVRHPKWQERPVLVIEPMDGAAIEPDQVLAYLQPHIAKWWLPNAVYVSKVPLTATGKIDKKLLRERYADCLIANAV